MGLAAGSRIRVAPARAALARRPLTRRPGPVILGLALTCLIGLFGLASMAAVLPPPASAARPTLTPYIPGRHVYDYGNLFTPAEQARAEALAASIENSGGGRVVVYTAELGSLPSADTLAEAWNVDGLLLTGWGDNGHVTLGFKLSGRLTQEAGKFVRDSSSGFESMQSFATSTLARVDGLLRHQHVFDGAGVLDAAHHGQAEAAAVTLGEKLGCQVFVDIAMTDDDDPESTAFFNSMSSSFARTMVIALAVHARTIGGWIDENGVDSDLYQTSAPWGSWSFSTEKAPGGDVQAEVMRAIGAVQPVPDPVDEAAKAAESVSTWIHDSVSTFFANETNVRASLAGLFVAIGAMAGLWFARRRRRREAGYANDDSVLLPAPPAEMTPALAAIVAAPLNSTRAVTVALLDLAAHGRIAFYEEPGTYGLGAGIRVVAGVGAAWHVAPGSAEAFERPLGPAEESLLDGLRAHARGSAGISPMTFGELRPLFEQTGELLERTAGERGWLRLETRSVSIAWTIVGLALLAGAAASAYAGQPIAFACLSVAVLKVLPGAMRMPLPLRTRDGQMTSAMVDAYRHTLRRALAGDGRGVPPWLANAEEAALWGYAWGLQGEVQAFVGRNVGATMDGVAPSGYGDVTSMVQLMRGMAGSRGANPVGMDTDAIALALGSLGRGVAGRSGEAAGSADVPTSR
jgi:uncharacterized membrane protein YgcG